MMVATWLVFFVALLTGGRVAAPPCESLTSLALPNTTITLAQTVPAGAVEPSFTAPAAFCRVAATLKPTADSDIKIEVWMPSAGWNGKFQAVGNGAFSGAIAYGAMRTALERGYATASTDTGHTGNTASFAPGHPEKVVDFGWRAAHEMTMAAKRIITAHYEKAPRYAYWNGCSAGGRQAMQEAQRFPGDFDGIIAGAPGLDWTGRAAQAVRVAKALETSEAARLSQSARLLLHDAAVRACDASDGVTDGLIGDPERCRFDPDVLRCASASASGCLSPAQIETARLIYSSARNSRTGREIGGLRPGSELGWTDLGWTASARATGLDHFRFIVFGDPAWTVARFDADADIARADTVDGGMLNALEPDLKPFFDRGGKLIQYHGWSDPQISPSNSTEYYRRVLTTLAGKTDVPASHRLFMAPGMGHCGGGEGPNTFDMLAALERWVEQRQPPDQIPASHSTNGRVDRTRPLCPFPRVAVYKGSGSTDESANFVCADRQ
jgi:feruloyl esterase